MFYFIISNVTKIINYDKCYFILFIHLDCDDCNINCIGECPVHGPYNIVKDVEVYKICIQKKNYNNSNLVGKLMHEKCRNTQLRNVKGTILQEQ